MIRLIPSWSVLLLLVLAASRADGLDITTQAFENGRSGANTQESTLTLANVATASFGKLFTIALDSDLGGQVLYRSNFAFGGSIGTHNAIFAYSATSVYAFDADSGIQLWHLTLSSASTNSDGNVTNTPVIDTTNNYMYFITKIQPSGNNFIHAVNLLNGNEGTGSPLQVTGSVPGTGSGSSGGTMPFPGSNANCRPGLLLLTVGGVNVIYSGYSNNGDGGSYHGWIVGYTYNPASGFSPSGIFCDTPNGNQGGIWQAGKGLASDGTSIFCTTGNGDFNTTVQSYSMSVLRLTPPGLAVADYFTPSNEASESGSDLDLGNCGMAIIPTTHYGFVGSTKYSQGHLVDINNLGHWNGGSLPNHTGNPDACLQTIANTPGTVGTNPVAWNGGANQFVYLKGGGTLIQWKLNTGGPVTLSQVASLSSVGGEGGLCLSSNGTSNGILWAMGTSNQISAYDATNVGNAVLWTSNQNAARDGYNGSDHWQFPLVANGKLYAPDTYGTIVVYGLLANQVASKLAFVQQPTSITIGASLSPAVTVAVEDPSGATVSASTAAVTISIANNPAGGTLAGTLTVNAVNGIATFSNLSINNPGTGYTLQAASSGLTTATSAAFNESGLAATPVIAPNGGSWSGPVTVALSDATAGAVIHYTTDGSAPGAGSATYNAASPPVLSATATVNAIAIAAGLGNSAVASATVTITGGTAYGMPTRPVVTGLNVPATNANPPSLLSQTGIFSNLATMTPAPGIVPYSPNSPLWSDNAIKTRWIALPGSSQITFQATGEWTFPGGTILIKNFDIGTDDTNAATVMRLETRLLVLNAAGTSGYGITYQWNSGGTDATLLNGASYLANGLDQTVSIATAGGGTRTQTWHYPSQNECLVCHTTFSGFVLGPKTRQLNGNFTYPATGVTDNQLRTWNYLGLFTTNIGEGNISGFTHMQPLTTTGDTAVDLVKSYIDANCANCHRPGGVNSNWDARYDTAMASANIINGTVAANLGIAGAKVVVPQETGASMLFYRMNVLGSSPPNPVQMPPVDRHEIDPNAITVIAQWINSLAPTAPVITSVAPGSGTAGTAVTIDGSNFAGATAVSFNGTPGSVTVASATTITTSVPAGATSGTITVTSPNGSGSSPGVFIVGAAPPAPTITAISPTSGSIGTTIILTGSGLTATSLVAFNGTAAIFSVISDSEVIATVPTGATSGTISVTTPGGVATSATFTVVAVGTVPLITAISPGTGSSGTPLIITGTGLGGATAVTIGGTQASFTINGPGTQITAIIPAGSSSGPVSVITPSGTATSSTTFTGSAGAAAAAGSSSGSRCGNGIFSLLGLLLLSVVLRRLRLRPSDH
jgi:uncharacterized repeat protein (TIGR03806 family)